MSLIRLACVLAAIALMPAGARGQDRASQALTLSDVLRAVAETHPLARAAEARVSAARGMRLTAGAWSNPIITHEVENAPWPGSNDPILEEREVMTSAMIPLEPLYQRWSRVGQANAEVRAAEAARAGVLRNLELDAVRAFYRVATAQVAVEAAAEVERWLDSLVRYTSARVREGVAAEGDLLRLQVERDRAGAETTLRQVDLMRARGELERHLGSLPAVPEPVVRFVDTVFTPERRSVDALMPIALERRPEVIELRERVTAARAARTTERTMIIRELSAMIGMKRMGGERSLMAGVSAPLPLFDQNRGEIRRAGAERAAAEYEQEWAVRSVRAEVSAAYDAMRALSSRARELQGALVARGEEARRITMGAYIEGATSLLQVLDAARTAAEARVAFYELLFAQHESVLELRSALGFSLTDSERGTP